MTMANISIKFIEFSEKLLYNQNLLKFFFCAYVKKK